MKRFVITTFDLRAAIRGYRRVVDNRSGDILELERLMKRGVQVLDRSTMDGHVTCGAIVLRDDGLVMLVHHRYLDRWLFPGGHVEDYDRSLSAAALRELREETGIREEMLIRPASLVDVPFMIERHAIPKNDSAKECAHQHWDFRFLYYCNGNIETSGGAEDTACGWRYPTDHSENVATAITRWREKLAETSWFHSKEVGD